MTGDGAGDEGKPETGKAAVRLHLIERLEAAGFVKPGRVGKEAFEAGKKYLAERLAYMSVGNLQMLAETIIDGASSREWPTETLLMQMARRIEAPPPMQCRAMTWLESKEGPMAVLRGDLVEIFRFIRAKLRPPYGWEMPKLAEQARENARRLVIISEWERSEAGARQEERAWRDAYLADQVAALALVDKGNARRAAVGDAA